MIPNYNLEIKRTFLSFAQNLFAEQERYTWNADPAKTKILIVDKYAIDLKVLEKRRSIVLSRGAFGWTYKSIGQLSGMSMIKQNQKTYTDLLRGSITFNCLAREGIVAENLAHILFAGLSGYKDQFRKNGIHQLMNINVGEEAILKSDSSIELTAIPVYVQFETQKQISTGFDFYSFYLKDVDDYKYYQGSDFEITSEGIIRFFLAPVTGTIITAYYIDTITLDTVEELLIGTINSSNTDFTVSKGIYGEYPYWSGVSLTTTGEAWS